MFPSEKWDAIQTVKCEFESYSGEEIEGLTAKVFGNVDLVPTNWLFPENCETILQKMLEPAGKYEGSQRTKIIQLHKSYFELSFSI